MSFPRYPKYKPSGVESLRDVPEHWDVSKMKWVATMESGHTPDKKVPAYWENGDIPWVSLNDTGFLKDNDYISETAYSISEAGIANSSARILPPRVVVFSRDATIGRCAITTRSMAVSQHFIAWVCGDSMIPEFLLLRLRSMTRELDRLTTGATLKTIGMPDVRTLATPVPPLQEQKSIIKWVSTETAKIDELVAEQRRLMELLKEKRQAVISHAVTQGLNPKAPMKPSGIEWLGDVPEHWEVFALKRLVSLRSGESITSETIEEIGDYPVYGGNGLRGYTTNFTHDGHYTLIGRQGALCGNINYAEGKFWASEHAVVVSPKKTVIVTWLGEMLRAMNLNQYSVSAAQPGLSVEIISNLLIPVPPQAEQNLIAAHLHTELAMFDTLTAEAQRAIDLLQERRTALISAAVTGQIDVRAVAVA